jgi:hypothetical protein
VDLGEVLVYASPTLKDETNSQTNYKS